MADTTGALTHRRVLKIAAPIVLSNATVPILAAVDTGVVGQLGQAAPIGAVGIGGIILTSIYWLFGFLRMGTTGLAGQALGAGDRAEVAALLTRALLIGMAGGIGVVLLHPLIFYLAFLASPASAEVESLARDYMSIRIWSAPAMIALAGVTGWLVAQERTGGVLAIQLVMNGLNIGLDLWFVLGLDFGVEGVAWATFIAEWTGLGVGLWLCRAAFRVPDWHNWERVFDTHRLRQMAAVNRDIFLRSLMLQFVFVSFLFWGGDFGDVTLAANQVLLQFLYITSYAMDGFAFAAEALVAQAFGARNPARVRRASLLTAIWSLAVVLVLSAVFATFGGSVIDLMATSDAVRAEARIYLIYMVAAPLLGMAAWVFDGIFIGATRGHDMRNMMAISFVIYIVSVVSLTPVLGNHGLWLALIISFVARGVTLALRYPALEAAARP